MPTLSCLYQRLRRSCQQQLLNARQDDQKAPAGAPLRAQPRGQVLVIFALSFFGLLAFVGLVTDVASLYVTYGQLKRAVDAAAIAAADEFKKDASFDNMTQAAKEVLNLQNIDMATVDLKVYVCDRNKDGIRDSSLQTEVPDFYAKCPDTTAPANERPRKLVYVDAKEKAPLYFLSLFGVHGPTLETNAISEAALVNLVLVFDVSGSMGDQSDGYTPNNYDPFADGNCNTNNSCQPLLAAKVAAKGLINTMYDGYDAVGIVTFSTEAHVVGGAMTTTMADAINLLDATYSPGMDKNNAGVFLNYDAPSGLMWGKWLEQNSNSNPVNPVDLDADGSNIDDTQTKYGYTCPFISDTDPTQDNPKVAGRWWSFAHGAPHLGWNESLGGVPCDSNHYLDAFDWNQNGKFDLTDEAKTEQFLEDKGWNGSDWGVGIDPNGNKDYNSVDRYLPFLSGNTTCTGCGMRVAANLLKSQGSPSAVWVIVFLSDGVANLTDTPYTNDQIPTAYPNGYCYGSLNPTKDVMWRSLCIKTNPTNSIFYPYTSSYTRFCINDDTSTCPPGSVITGSFVDHPEFDPHQYYSPEDYAMDMTDQAALLKSSNTHEKKGNDIAIYSIGLGQGALGRVSWNFDGVDYQSYGEGLLRYMAAVGYEGDRTTDRCAGVPQLRSCGNYYNAPTSSDLPAIFASIASRIYTKITE